MTQATGDLAKPFAANFSGGVAGDYANDTFVNSPVFGGAQTTLFRGGGAATAVL